MRTPLLIAADDLKGNWPLRSADGGKWVAARPHSYGPWWWRFRLAFGVLIGRYDALRWLDGEQS
ncbi:hypothetical protein M8A51_25740 [Schlegelella sp. S2-27]|uniref:Uncharacterized protein n=1 Tax=Caldimonas mangrovi TaxID=2944811 RepID=A0ABT0YW10_9BURK|nr:hypothetical protein [Caldimonas mangrovi]MCM5682940.1 hypothetical protein [Caldimonas mangrovi]